MAMMASVVQSHIFLYFLLFLEGCIKRRFVHLSEIGVQQEPVEVAFIT